MDTISYPHGNQNLPIPTVAYVIKTLNSQSSGRGRGGPPTSLYVGDIFYKTINYN